MWQLLLQAFFALLIATITVAALLYAIFDWSLFRLTVRVLKRLDPRRPKVQPTGRPIELIAPHARRLWRQSRMPEKGRSRAKQLAIREAYDHVLAEGCDALGLPHLLSVLPPGDDRDVERDRVEDLLEEAGLRLRQLS
jgi:hypothetical protein